LNPHVAIPSNKSDSRWWRLDPRVAAHLRATATPWTSLLAGAPAAARRSANARDNYPHTFAATRWADTEWADTRSDPLTD
jgi:hypothetical protein